MKAPKTLAVIALVGAAVTAPVANAQETVLQNLLSRMLTSAVEITMDELENQAVETVANTAHTFSPDNEVTGAKVTVTELAATDTKQSTPSKSE